VKSAAAVVGQSEAAYLPSVTGTAQYTREHVSTDVRDSPTLNSTFTDHATEGTAALTWLLIDFGGRSATLNSSRLLLSAARASQDQELQNAFANVAKDYFTASVADAKVESTHRIEAAATQTLEAATARVAKGVAAITDQLQANTAHAQAAYERAKAENDRRAALGTLAIEINVPPDESFSVQKSDLEPLPELRFTHSVQDHLVEDAIRTSPRVVSADAQWKAALARTREVRAAGLPTLSMVGQMNYSTRPVSASLGQEEQPAKTRDNYIGLKLSVPLFEGFSRTYQVREAEAQSEAQEQTLRDIKRTVAVAVWSSYQTLQSDTDNLRNTDTVVQSARESFTAVEQRYQLGVGNILELLDSQNRLANAEQQFIQAQFEWRNARIQLALSVGRLDTSDLH
jgi:outer membrane protein